MEAGRHLSGDCAIEKVLHGQELHLVSHQDLEKECGILSGAYRRFCIYTLRTRGDFGRGRLLGLKRFREICLSNEEDGEQDGEG